MLGAWRDLETCRAYIGVGMAGSVPAPLAWTTIVDWCRVQDLDAAATAVVTCAIRVIDNDYLARCAAERA